MEKRVLNIDVYQGRAKSFVPEKLSNIEDVFGLVIQLCCFPVSSGMRAL